MLTAMQKLYMPGGYVLKAPPWQEFYTRPPPRLFDTHSQKGIFQGWGGGKNVPPPNRA